jgi:hypothetical protein
MAAFENRKLRRMSRPKGEEENVCRNNCPMRGIRHHEILLE